jgi:membrane protein DedA with SNARE-associated domain
VPGGRLVSTAAAGRLGLPPRRLLAGSVASSILWAVYMLVIGFAVGPMTGGNPLMCVAAGAVMAVVTAGGYAVASRIRTAVLRRRSATVAASARPALATR